MSDAIIQAVQESQIKTDLPEVAIGDTVDVDVRIIEGSKERLQTFQGVVIAINGQGLEQTITVRRIVANEGVERIFPVHSPRVAGIRVLRRGHARRSKLYYLRDRVGKKRRLADRRRGVGKGSGGKGAPGAIVGNKARAQSKAAATSPAQAAAVEQDEQPVQEEAGRKGDD